MDRQGISPEWSSYLKMLRALEEAAYEVAFRSGPVWSGAAAYFLEALEDKASEPAAKQELLEEVREAISYRLQEGHWQ